MDLARAAGRFFIEDSDASRGVNDPPGAALGRAARSRAGSFTPRLSATTVRGGSLTGGRDRRPTVGLCAAAWWRFQRSAFLSSLAWLVSS
jgi:hypothetical protein